MSNPQAVGYVDENDTFRGVYVHWGIDSDLHSVSGTPNDVEEWLGGKAFQETIDRLIESAAGFSTAGSEVNAYDNESTSPVIVEGFSNRTQEQVRSLPMYVSGFWVVGELDFDIEQDYREHLSETGAQDSSDEYEGFKYDVLGEEGIGLISDNLTFTWETSTPRTFAPKKPSN